MMDRCWGRGVCALVTEALAMEGEGVAREDSLDEIAELPLDTDLACLPGGCSVGAPAKLPKVRVGLIGDDCILQNLWNRRC